MDEVVENQILKIKLANERLKEKEKITSKDKTLLELADKAEERMMAATGISNSPNQSKIIQTIFNQQNNIISPEVAKILEKYSQEDVIDCETETNT